MRRKPLLAMLLFLLLAYTIIGGGVITTSTGDLPVIYVDPETTNTTRGSDFTVDINIANVTWANSNDSGVYGYEFRISFNVSLVKVVKIMEGPWLKSTWEDTLFTSGYDNEAGTLLATNFMPNFPDEGIIGSGTLANITFTTGEAENEGTCPLDFYKTELRYWDWDLYDYGAIEHTSKNGSVTVNPGHDVAVVSITAPLKASVNENVPINVTIRNEGSFPETGNVTLYYDTTEIGTENFTNLPSAQYAGDPLARTNASFTWNTAGRTPGSYNLTATVTLPVENDTTDNSGIKSILLVEHDMAVTKIDAPKKVVVGENVAIDVTVENLGIFTEAFNLTISYDSILIGFNDTVELPAGNSSILSFSWNTSGIADDQYTINATATILPTLQNPSGTDDDPTDNFKIKLITLQEVHDIEVVSITATAVAVNSNVPVKVKVENQGSYVEEVNVTLYYTPVDVLVFIDSQNVTMAPLTSTTVTLTWDTTGVAVGSYVITATATIPGLYKFLEDTVSTTIACDVNADNKVDASDLSAFMEAYGSEPGDPNWNPSCDFNWDSKVDVSDLFALGENYGNTA